jgi:ATP-dependent Clp protease ATP-binding subunit ClpC
LTRDEVRVIASRYMDTLAATLRHAGRTFSIDADALERLVHEGYNAAYGARFLKRVLDEHVKLPISLRWREGSTFRVVVRDDAVTVESMAEQTPPPASLVSLPVACVAKSM